MYCNFDAGNKVRNMRIQGIEGMRPEELLEELEYGGRFVFFEYCISCLVFSLRRPTDVFWLPGNEWGWVRALPYSLLTLCLGWWGLPWGLIYTPLTLVTNLAGGCDVTDQTCEYLSQLPGWEALRSE